MNSYQKIIEDLVKNKPDSFVQIIKAHYKNFYNNINDNFTGKNFAERLYKWHNKDNDKIGKCEKCGKNTRFISFNYGYAKYCSKKCANISTVGVRAEKLTKKEKNPKFWVETDCELCGKKFYSLISKNGKFCSNDCSVRFTANDVDKINKIKQTRLEKYGKGELDIVAKVKKTTLERFGVDNISKCEEGMNRIKKANLEKYGVEWSFQSEEVKNKLKMTNLERYGNVHALSSDIIKERTKKTNLEKYGVDNIFKKENIHDQIKKTNLKKYGVEYYSMTDEFKNGVKRKRYNKTYNINKERYAYKVDFLFTIDEFNGTYRDNLYRFRCKICNGEFIDNMDGGGRPRCMECFPIISGYSKGEKEIIKYIKSLNDAEIIIERDRSILNGLELDIYLPDKKLAIEFNGLFWHGELYGNKNKNYHLNKTIKCHEKGIRLIQIFEDEWLFNKDIIKNKIKYILNRNNDKLYADKCLIINDLDNELVADLLLKNSLDNSSSIDIKIGLYYNNNLMEMLLINKIKDGEYNIINYIYNELIMNGFDILLNYFIKNYLPDKIIGYIDIRWDEFDNNIFNKFGFKKVEDICPNYYYYKPGKYDRFNKVDFKILDQYDPDLDEWDNMKNNRYDRIWDCGMIKYEWINK